MKIRDLNDEEKKAFEEYLLSTYRYDEKTGKLISYGNIVWCSFLCTIAFPRRLTISMASRPTTALKICAR